MKTSAPRIETPVSERETLKQLTLMPVPLR
jgi:hypothetical protein